MPNTTSITKAVKTCLFATLLIFPALMTGCSKEPGAKIPGQPVTIVLTHGEDIVSEGMVDLIEGGGGATLNSQGEAIFQNVPFGEYKVVVIPPSGNADPPPVGQTLAKAPPAKNIPEKFQSDTTTPLSLKVESGGETRFEFDLKP